MKIDKVREGKVADKSGILDGDIVIKMDTIIIEDMMTYMEALGKFKKGDTVLLKY